MIDVSIRGTFNEIMELDLWTTEQLCGLLRIDPCKMCMVDRDREVFTITHTTIINWNMEGL